MSSNFKWHARTVALAAGAMLALLPSAASASAAPPERAEPAPLYGTDASAAIAGSYIVVLADDAPAGRVQEVSAVATAAGATITMTYDHAIRGFAGTLPDAALDAVRSAAGVAFVEADALVSVPKQVDEAGRRSDRSAVADGVQKRATWGLDRIDQRDGFDWKYRYDATGAGVTAYVIDTGIRKTHVDFEGRARHGFTSINDGRGSDDCNGHGTHVAATVGGQEVGGRQGGRTGRGPGAGLRGRRLHQRRHRRRGLGHRRCQRPGRGQHEPDRPASAALDQAVDPSIASGIPYAVAAGNSHENACGFSPARAPAAITVGATDDLDWDAMFSNYGTCLDLFAPGDYVTSAWAKTSDTAKKTISGTSMASPHVAGVAAIYVEQHPSATPTQVRDAIVNGADP